MFTPHIPRQSAKSKGKQREGAPTENQKPTPSQQLQARMAWIEPLKRADGAQVGWGLPMPDVKFMLDIIENTGKPVTASNYEPGREQALLDVRKALRRQYGPNDPRSEAVLARMAPETEGTHSERWLNDLQGHSIEWGHLLTVVQEKCRQPLALTSQIDAIKLCASWEQFVERLDRCIDSAHNEIGRVIGAVQTQRKATYQVTGRMLWGTLSLAVPPPVGVLLGSVAICLTESEWVAGGQKLLEWGLQTPFLFQPNSERVVAPSYARRYQRDRNGAFPNMFPIARNPGGQETVKDTKDFNQMIKDWEKLYSGKGKELFDAWNKKTLFQAWTQIAKLGPKDTTRIHDVFRSSISFTLNAFKAGLQDLLAPYSADPDKTKQLIRAAIRLKQAEINASLAAGEDVTNQIADICLYFLNRVAHESLEELRSVALTAPPELSDDGEKQIKRTLQRLVLAQYFAKNTVRTPRAMGVRDRRERWADERGEVKAEIFKPHGKFTSSFVTKIFGHALEEKLLELEVIAPVIANDIEQQLLEFEPIRYGHFDRATRGALAEWAARERANCLLGDSIGRLLQLLQ